MPVLRHRGLIIELALIILRLLLRLLISAESREEGRNNSFAWMMVNFELAETTPFSFLCDSIVRSKARGRSTGRTAKRHSIDGSFYSWFDRLRGPRK